MTTSYIVKYINNTNEDEIDGFAELTKTKNNIPVLTVRTHKEATNKSNVVLLYKFITNNFANISFEDNTTQCILSYRDGYNNTVYTCNIMFDGSSSSAYADFKKKFNEMYSTKYETRYYPSRREKYVGEVICRDTTSKDNLPIKEALPNGRGTIYYDLPYHKMKYTGDFDAGVYDGMGTFYSRDNKIYLVAKNISYGIPTQIGKLHINYNNKKEVIEIKFNEVWEKLNISEKNNKKLFVQSDSFVNDLATMYLDQNTISINELIFQDKTKEEKYNELWKILIDQNNAIKIIDNNVKTQSEFLSKVIVISTALIICANIITSLWWTDFYE